MRMTINTILLLGCIISLSITLKLSPLPLFDFIPLSIGGLLISSTEMQARYALFYDLSIGFILSAMFYFIVSELPEKIKMSKAKKMLNPSINQLMEAMEHVISLTIAVYGRPNNLKLLTEKDFLVLNGECSKTQQEISFSTVIYYNNGKRKTAFRSYGTLAQLIKNSINNIMLREIALIKNYEFFYGGYVELVEYIRMLEACKFLDYYRTTNSTSKNQCFLFHGTSTAMVDFINLYKQLQKLRLHTEYSKTTLDTQKETDEYRKKRESGAFFEKVIQIQQKEFNKFTANPIAVLFGKKYTSNIIVEQMKKDCRHAQYMPMEDDFDLFSLKQFKYIILIADNLSIKVWLYLSNNIDFKIDIILLSEQFLLKRSYQRRLKSKYINIIDELHFKHIYQISFTHIYMNKGEPSGCSIHKLINKIEKIIPEI